MTFRSAFAALITLLPAIASAAAQQPPSAIELRSGEGTVIDINGDVSRAYTSSPETADVAVVERNQLLVNGKAPGVSTLIIWTKNGSRTVIGVRVTDDLAPARALLAQTFPSERIEISGTKDSIVVSGRATSQETVDRVSALLKPFAKSVVSNAEIAPARGVRQIGLRIVFAELDRTRLDSFAVNLLSTGGSNTIGRTSTGQFSGANPSQLTGTIGAPAGGTQTTFNLSDALNIFAFRPDLNFGATVKDLENRGVLQILAQPDLVASDGKEARFVVGGEFPVPIVQAGATPGAISVQYREFGIRLAFLPHITPNGTIQMHLAPEVSTLDSADGVVISGFNIPALSTRKVETDIELKADQSFVIAGLLDDRVMRNLSRVPGLSNIPLLGQIFRSHDQTKTKTELVVIVTPEIRYPLPENTPAPLPVMPEPFLDKLPPAPAKVTK